MSESKKLFMYDDVDRVSETKDTPQISYRVKRHLRPLRYMIEVHQYTHRFGHQKLRGLAELPTRPAAIAATHADARSRDVPYVEYVEPPPPSDAVGRVLATQQEGRRHLARRDKRATQGEIISRITDRVDRWISAAATSHEQVKSEPDRADDYHAGTVKRLRRAQVEILTLMIAVWMQIRHEGTLAEFKENVRNPVTPENPDPKWVPPPPELGWQAMADWLQERGDPMGETIMLALQYGPPGPHWFTLPQSDWEKRLVAQRAAT